MQSHLHQNQNQCVEQPNRMLANGPNHPGPGPEEIPMVDVSPNNNNTQLSGALILVCFCKLSLLSEKLFKLKLKPECLQL